MSKLTEQGREVVETSAQRHGFSEAAVRHMLESLAVGQGSQAQFNHPEFGGMGQWSRGGMTMIGDMFNNGLKARVDGLCADLSGALSGAALFEAPRVAPGGSWSYSASQSGGGTGWPAALGQPASQGAQNDMRYAFFPETRRLAIAHGGKTTVYDTGDHRISGFGQAQGSDQTLSFTSQYGLVSVAVLEVVDPDAPAARDTPEPAPATTPDTAPPAPAAPPPPAVEPPGPDHAAMSDEQIFARLEKLADLRDRGILSEEEFSDKKRELLARL